MEPDSKIYMGLPCNLPQLPHMEIFSYLTYVGYEASYWINMLHFGNGGKIIDFQSKDRILRLSNEDIYEDALMDDSFRILIGNNIERPSRGGSPYLMVSELYWNDTTKKFVTPSGIICKIEKGNHGGVVAKRITL